MDDRFESLIRRMRITIHCTASCEARVADVLQGFQISYN
jgi:hypothetical protein